MTTTGRLPDDVAALSLDDRDEPFRRVTRDEFIATYGEVDSTSVSYLRTYAWARMKDGHLAPWLYLRER